MPGKLNQRLQRLFHHVSPPQAPTAPTPAAAAGSGRVLPPTEQRVEAIPKERWPATLQKGVPQKRPGNVFTCMANHPAFFEEWLRWSNHVVFKSTLMASHTRQRNLALSRTGWLKNCGYVFQAYSTMGGFLDKGGPADFTAADLAAIEAGPSDPHWASEANAAKSNDAALDAAVLAAADELHRDACVLDDTWEALTTRLTLEQTVDIVAAIGHYTLNSYLLNALGVQPDRPLPGFRERAGEPVGMAGGPSARKMRIEPIEYQDSRSKRLNVLKTMNKHKDMNRRWMSWASYVLADEPTNSVSRRLREIAILRVGWLCNSTYEWHQHVRMAKADTDIDDDDVRAIEVGASDPNWGAEERAVLQVADELRFTGCVRDESWAELRALFSVQQIFDIVGACGQYTLVSYMLNSFGVQLEGEDVTPRWPRFRADVNME